MGIQLILKFLGREAASSWQSAWGHRSGRPCGTCRETSAAFHHCRRRSNQILSRETTYWRQIKQPRKCTFGGWTSSSLAILGFAKGPMKWIQHCPKAFEVYRRSHSLQRGVPVQRSLSVGSWQLGMVGSLLKITIDISATKKSAERSCPWQEVPNTPIQMETSWNDHSTSHLDSKARVDGPSTINPFVWKAPPQVPRPKPL